jgi:8-oxo-dGTP pyrophosphatase MutT (NUDIX family)
MKLNNETVTTPPRPAATVLLLRDTADGPEVFMIRRHDASDVLGGAYVFPGGKVDRADAEPESLQRLEGDPRRMHEVLGEDGLDPAGAAALFFAAARETFEECGVLLAKAAGTVHQHRGRELLREGRGFAETVGQMALAIEAASLLPWSRWITPRVPSVMNKRFDTRFFVTAMPPGQQPAHDNHEASESEWMRPRVALDRYWARELALAPPQIMTLAHLSRYARVSDILGAAAGRPPPTIEPEPFDVDGTRVIAYPGDARHPTARRAMPGPTRLAFRSGRFEPEGGFDAFFG